MSSKYRMRVLLILATMLVGVLFIIPTVIEDRPDWLAGITPERGAQLGLDLQGGMYLVLQVQVSQALEGRLRRYRQDFESHLEEQGVEGKAAVKVTGVTGLELEAPRGEATVVRSWLDERSETLQVLESGPTDGRAVWRVGFTPEESQRIRDWAVLQSKETIRNRVDQYGVLEPSIQRQGEDRIVVQLPGVENPDRAVDLIGKTAQLTFHMYRDDLDVSGLRGMVDELTTERPSLRRDVGALNAALAATLPAGVEVRFQRIPDEFGSRTEPVLVEADPMMTGESIVDARVRIASQYNEPYVALEFDDEGGRRFAEITEQHVGDRFAIVLDEVVYSAPVIRERIPGGRASIEGGFAIEEARDLAIVLRAGALPAPVKILEERTIGPSLGQDSIRRGVRAIVLGGLLVIVFMLVYYKYGGLVANISLVANMIYLLGALGMFEATLTLPGLAGIILTIGMAVDGNVIVFERIREELRLGKSVRAAVDGGYAKALSAVLDANITTMIAAVVLFQFGTGPVRGFAVTLTVGIATTLFSVLFVSRTFMDLYVQRRGVRSLPI